MKIMLVGSGSAFSTADVEEGYHKALLADGHDVGLYALTQRVAIAKGYLDYRWRKAGRPQWKPSMADVSYLACEEIAQRAWCNEADWVLFVAGRHVHPDAVLALHYSGMTTALIATESPYDDEYHAMLAPFFSVLFVNERTSVERLREHNANTFYLGPAYDPDKHHPASLAFPRRREFGVSPYPPPSNNPDDVILTWSPSAAKGRPGPVMLGDGQFSQAEGSELEIVTHVDESAVPAHDVVFVGSDFPERMRTLAAVNWQRIDLALYGQWPYGRRSAKLRPYIRGGIVANQSAAGLYRKAKVGLNLYRTLKGFDRKADQHVSGAESLNPRSLELAACSVFTISDYRAEVEETFGDAVPTFRTPAELETLVRYYLQHDDERRANAARLPGLVAGHTYADRVSSLIEVLTDLS